MRSVALSGLSCKMQPRDWSEVSLGSLCSYAVLISSFFGRAPSLYCVYELFQELLYDMSSRKIYCVIAMKIIHFWETKISWCQEIVLLYLT